MERTIYSKYSNERALPFRIRTDIVMGESNRKKVYKYALYPEGEAHIRQIAKNGERLNVTYAGSGISFCACEEIGDGAGKSIGVQFPFLPGVSLQDCLEAAVQGGDEVLAERILRLYIRRVLASGGDEPFAVTGEFTEVFGECVPEDGLACAGISDVDLIFSNIFLPAGARGDDDVLWTVIDYEWTFDFLIPKAFLVYRALYFAYHQVLYDTEWSLESLLELADITAEQAVVFQRMEEHFQQYLGKGSLPVRNMQRVMGTRIWTLPEMRFSGDMSLRQGGEVLEESAWIKVRKLLYHIDRQVCQDGSVICSGWACARAWDGRSLPVNIQVTDQDGREIPAQIERRERADVARALKICNVTRPVWGFDCVWIAAQTAGWRIIFSLGNKKKVYEI
ncbi:MAG: hypothetical protein ACLT3H_05490 [Roseburia sp.]